MLAVLSSGKRAACEGGDGPRDARVRHAGDRFNGMSPCQSHSDVIAAFVVPAVDNCVNPRWTTLVHFLSCVVPDQRFDLDASILVLQRAVCLTVLPCKLLSRGHLQVLGNIRRARCYPCLGGDFFCRPQAILPNLTESLTALRFVFLHGSGNVGRGRRRDRVTGYSERRCGEPC